MKHELKIALIRRLKQTAILLVLALSVIAVSELYVAPWGVELAVEAAAQSDINSKIEATEKTVAQLTESVETSGKTLENLWQIRADYIAELGDMAQDHNLILVQLTSDSIFPVAENSSVMALPITLSVQGDLDDISDFVWALTRGETLVAVEKISYRTGTTEEFSWMWRTIDENVLLPWWDITSYIDDYYESQAKSGSISGVTYALTIDDLMQSSGDPTCYLELNIIGTGG